VVPAGEVACGYDGAFLSFRFSVFSCQAEKKKGPRPDGCAFPRRLHWLAGRCVQAKFNRQFLSG
jgi:hypothetical protein